MNDNEKVAARALTSIDLLGGGLPARLGERLLFDTLHSINFFRRLALCVFAS